MGFGTLFTGYFLLLNLTYYGFTDIIAALIMLLGLYKLSGINRPFKYAFTLCAVFSVFSFFEFILRALEMLDIKLLSTEGIAYFSAARYALICILTASMLMGIKLVTSEVDLPTYSSRASVMLYLSSAIYILSILLETPPIIQLLPDALIAVLALIAIFGALVTVAFNLTIIWGCYSKICMPGEKLTEEPMQSKFAFVNEYRKRQAEKANEYAKYKLEKAKRATERRKGNDKK